MQTCWLRRDGHPACLLFFAGWGMDPAPFQALLPENRDLLMVYDYRDLATPNLADLLPGQYQRLDLLAWSMGVWVASRLLAGVRQRFGATVAVNGTLTPIDDLRGIPAQAYASLLATFSPVTLDDFYQNMFSDPAELELFLAHRPRRPAEAIQAELAALRDHYLAHGPAADIYSHKLAGRRDRVFAVRAQVRAWGRESCQTFPGPHFPFYAQSWEQLLGTEASRARGQK